MADRVKEAQRAELHKTIWRDRRTGPSGRPRSLHQRITVVGKKSVNKVHDPACGSDSLLLKFAKVLGKDKVRQGFFGQEINLTTYNLARINMFLHDINYEKFDIAHGDTLIDPAQRSANAR